jgi:hypothetical protein
MTGMRSGFPGWRAVALGVSIWSVVAQAGAPPMGTPADVDYARKLWGALVAVHLTGKKARPLEPFFGGARPHGMILELTYRKLRVGEHVGFLVLKRNYNGEDVSVENVTRDRARYLSSVTVMYRREKGYDPDNQDWFWAKFKPDGSLHTNPKGVELAGRILKGPTRDESRGCIYCHASAGGGDYVFYPEIQVPGYTQSD